MTDRMDVAYGMGDGRELKLDVYAPEPSKSLRTAVLQFHGGGWRRGDRKNLAPHARLLQADGFTAIPVQYRLLDESPWPSAVHDVKAAIRWVRAHAAEMEVDPDRIALEGFSAGAHLSLMAAGTEGMPEFEAADADLATSCGVGAIAVFYPPTLFHVGDVRERGSLAANALLGENAEAAAARAASPLTHVSAAFPPVFLLHGGADRVVPTSSSVVMYEALRVAGVDADLHIFAGQNHGFDHVDVFREVVAKEVSLFFRRTVAQKEAIAQRILDQSMFAQRAREAAAAGGRS